MGSIKEIDDFIDYTENQATSFANKITIEEKIFINYRKDADFDLTLGELHP